MVAARRNETRTIKRLLDVEFCCFFVEAKIDVSNDRDTKYFLNLQFTTLPNRFAREAKFNGYLLTHYYQLLPVLEWSESCFSQS